MPLAPVIALSHGGGPMPLLGDPAHASITASLRTRVPFLLGLHSPHPPRAIILVTAHWSAPEPRISCAPHHALLYDYHGFPPAAYHLQHPAPGDPQLARAVAAALQGEGFAPVLDGERGWDHGVFVPLKLVDPGARVPVVQVSVLGKPNTDAADTDADDADDAERHFRMGRALRAFRRDGVAVLGSGFASLHNFAAYAGLRRGGPSAEAWAAKVDAWNAALGDALGEGDERRGGRENEEEEEEEEDGVRRSAALRGWRELPHAWDVHPRGAAEHLMPLMVCAGAAMEGERPASYGDEFLGAEMMTFYWGAEGEPAA